MSLAHGQSLPGHGKRLHEHGQSKSVYCASIPAHSKKVYLCMVEVVQEMLNHDMMKSLLI
jgi:hypothetical protein